jgi:proteasome regulatory subunit
VHTRSLAIDDDVDLIEIAQLTDGRNGADLYAICMEAGMYAIRKESPSITQENFRAAVAKVIFDFNRGSLDVEGEMFA